jgi:hypothetical protein
MCDRSSWKNVKIHYFPANIINSKKNRRKIVSLWIEVQNTVSKDGVNGKIVPFTEGLGIKGCPLEKYTLLKTSFTGTKIACTLLLFQKVKDERWEDKPGRTRGPLRSSVMSVNKESVSDISSTHTCVCICLCVCMYMCTLLYISSISFIQNSFS